jgi:sugar (pentulose or hexulose) kinase
MTSADYLAFDLGASGGKLLLGRFDGERLSFEDVYRFGNEPISANGCLYWDLMDIHRHMKLGIRKAVALAGGRIRSMGIDSFSNDFAFMDRRGELLTPLRCYRDARTERHRDAIYAKMPPERLYALTGNQVAPFNTLMQLAAMIEAGQGHILENAHRLLFTPDILVHFMTGEAVSEYTIASVSQMFDFSRNGWSDEILGAFGIPRDILCPISRPGTVVGRTTQAFCRELGVEGFDLVSVCEHDTASAYLAATSAGERAIISSGTWSLVGTEVPAPLILPAGYRDNIANEGGLVGRHRLVRNVMGLWILQELRRQWAARDIQSGGGGHQGFAEMEAAAARAAPFAHRINPDDPRLFSPVDMEATVAECCVAGGDATGSAAASQTMGETVRCILEGLAFKYRWAIERIEALTGRHLPSVDIIGGGSRNALLCQFTADACDRPVRAGMTDATALGNLMVQLLADRQISSIEEGKELIKRTFPIKEYLPREAGVWAREYEEFKKAFALG